MSEESQDHSNKERADLDLTDTSNSSSGADEDTSTVLELFGVELKVRNQRLAEVLKMMPRMHSRPI